MKFLVERAKKYDKEAFVELMELYKMDMYKVARGYFSNEEDIADAIQDAMLSCYENILQLKENKYFKTWLIRILINSCNQIYQSHKAEVLLETFPDIADSHCHEANVEFTDLLNSLEEKYRLVVILYYSEGFKIREIAQIIDLPENTVKTRLIRARKKLEGLYCSQSWKTNEA